MAEEVADTETFSASAMHCVNNVLQQEKWSMGTWRDHVRAYGRRSGCLAAMQAAFAQEKLQLEALHADLIEDVPSARQFLQAEAHAVLILHRDAWKTVMADGSVFGDAEEEPYLLLLDENTQRNGDGARVLTQINQLPAGKLFCVIDEQNDDSDSQDGDKHCAAEHGDSDSTCEASDIESEESCERTSAALVHYPSVYQEEQQPGTETCGKHVVNHVLGADVYSQESYYALVPDTAADLRESPGLHVDERTQGWYSIEHIGRVLRRNELDVRWVEPPESLSEIHALLCAGGVTRPDD